MKRILLLAMAVLLVMPASLFAQRKATQTVTSSFVLTVTVNPANATVVVDGASAKGNAFTVAAGNHTVQVSAPGYQNFQTTVAVAANMSLPVNLVPSNFTVSFQVNPSNASVTVDGQQAKGNVFTLAPGQHTVIAGAVGYETYQSTFNVSGNITIPVTLTSVMYSVQIQVNPNNATVTLDGQASKGNYFNVMPGNHTLVASAPGYQTYQSTITVTATATIPVNLNLLSYNLTVLPNPANAKVSVDGQQSKGNVFTVLPGQHTVLVEAPGYVSLQQFATVAGNMNFPVTLQLATGTLNIPALSVKGNTVKVMIDGKPSNAASLALSPGQHTVRFTAGALSTDVVINIVAGQSLTLEAKLVVEQK